MQHEKAISVPSSVPLSKTSSPDGQRTLDAMLRQEKTNTSQTELKSMIQALHEDLKERIGKVDEKIEKVEGKLENFQQIKEKTEQRMQKVEKISILDKVLN